MPDELTPPTGAPLSCERCGLPHVRCKAHTKGGEPCQQPRMRGQLVCRKHGGKTPGALEKAAERLADEEANQVLAGLWTGLDSAEPVTDPRRALQKLAGALTAMTDEVGRDITALKSVEVKDDRGRLRGKVLLFVRLLEVLRGVLTDMNRLGLAEQLVQLERDQARHVVTAVNAGLDELEVTPEERDRFVSTMMRTLRLEAGEVV